MPPRAGRHVHGQQGFTLTELIIVLVLVGIMAAVSTVFILQPFQASQDLERRAALVDAADVALSRIVRESRGALPNSVRVHDSGHLEFIATRSAGRYRRLPATTGGGNLFNPAASSGTFDVLGGLAGDGLVNDSHPGGRDCGSGIGDCLSVFNTGQPGLDAYRQQNVAGITSASASSLSYSIGGSGRAFAAHSPQQRFYVISDTVSYVCEDGALYRYAGYGLFSGVPDLGGVERFKVAGQVTDCQFTYATGDASRRGLLSLRLELQAGGEVIRLHAQSQVLNSP